MVARFLRKVKVAGSNPAIPTRATDPGVDTPARAPIAGYFVAQVEKCTLSKQVEMSVRVRLPWR